MSPETEAAFQRMAETVNNLAASVQSNNEQLSASVENSIAAQQTSNAHLTASIQQSIANQIRQNSRVDDALEALAEHQAQLVLRIDDLAQHVRGVSQQMGDMQALVRSNREILAEMRRNREDNHEQQ